MKILIDSLTKYHLNRIIAFAFFLFAVFITSCKKDKNDDNNPTVNKLEESYFKADKGSFVQQNFPSASNSANAPFIDAIFGNASILEGGSNPVSITTTSQVKNVLVGVQGIIGYYKVPASLLKDINATILVVLLFSQNFEKDSFVIIIAIENNQGLVSAHETIQVNRIEAGTGKLQISCSWDKPNDVDLHLVEPNGEEIYYGNSISANGGFLDVDSNAGCGIDNINNENITYNNDAIIQSGTYIVRIDYWSNCEVNSNTNYIVTVRYNGQLITPVLGTNPYTGYFKPEEENFGGLGDGKEIVKFNIAANKNRHTETKKYGFTYSKPPVIKKSNKGMN